VPQFDDHLALIASATFLCSSYTTLHKSAYSYNIISHRQAVMFGITATTVINFKVGYVHKQNNTKKVFS